LRAEGAAITVHVVGFKVRDKFFSWESQNEGSGEGASLSRCLAEGTGGLYISTETTDELVKALQRTLSCPLLSSVPSVE
jgi:Ca-activated chloride channel family protein